ncbi:hypothetical protein [Lutibacter sp.]|uniref:hypothetical protein n=1 Tax=Lutibacter sp. TaxID=1925666 RepID=UPI00273258DB|nr:hypothetical protein [Lutibacter sp.]MDP3314123.1 hypothetical protein [Lutibacter sp.]
MRNLRKHLVYIFLVIGIIGYSQQNLIKVTVDTTAIKIGEQIQYKISVEGKRNILFSKFALDSLGKIEVVESFPVDTLKNSLEKRYLLTSFDSGRYVIPKQQVLLNNKIYLTDSVLINVATVKVDTLKQKMFEIKAIKSEPKTFDDYKPLLWWILLILAIIAIALYFILRKKKVKEIPVIYIAPIQEAMQRLKELDEKQLLQQNKIKLYYTELTEIVRTYIEKETHIPALESTTNELIETIIDFNSSSNLGISKNTIIELKEVLQSADLVKFAKSKPIVEEIKQHRNLSEQIIQNIKTIKKEENELE